MYDERIEVLKKSKEKDIDKFWGWNRVMKHLNGP
jgi:hypothetical protein